MNKEKVIRNFALANAVKYAGSAKPGNIVGGIIQAYPDWKAEIKSLMPMIGKIVGEVNKMTVAEQMAELQQNAPELLEKKRDERPKDELKPLKNAEFGKVVMRFEPSPSGTLHVGHAIPFLLNVQYCKQYDGKLILRLADTNPDNIDPDCYTRLVEDAQWLSGDFVSSVVIQSERMEIYYQHLLELIERGHAYVDYTPAEDFREMVGKGIETEDRKLGAKEHVARWHKMLTDLPEGKAVVRMKTDFRHKNPALRDFPLARINCNEHPKQGKKYRVWPLMNLAVAIDDHDLGLTHVLRGKDHLDNTRRQMYIYDAFKWTPPEFIHTGIVNFVGLKLSASGTQKAIAAGEFSGWDDIRVPFMPAYRRRGFKPEAFLKFVVQLGVTMVDKNVEASEFFKTLQFFNKEIIDPISDRYFFVEAPKEIVIDGAPAHDIELDLHPENKKGGRKFHCTSTYLISSSDLESFSDVEFVRLMDNLNFKCTLGKYAFDSLEYENWKGVGKKIIHWLPKNDQNVDVRLVMDDGSVRLGIGEAGLAKLSVGDTIQLERVCFATYQGLVDGAHEFWYLHR